MDFTLQPHGDYSIIIDVGGKINETTLQRVQTITSYLEKKKFDWIVEYVPSFQTVTIYYDPIKVAQIQPLIPPYDYVSQQLNSLHDFQAQTNVIPRTITIPVCYGGELGPDLQHVADFNDLSTEEVIDIHANGSYLVYMIGFSPGFPYIGGMSERIATPRRSSPRSQIPAGAVGIAGIQTGIYPLKTPGGWQIIGQTPKKLFIPSKIPPSLLKAGDRIKFSPITYQEFVSWKGEEG